MNQQRPAAAPDEVLRLWAPACTTVELETESGSVPMVPDEHEAEPGWWRSSQPVASPGLRYRFVVDGEPIPDPRSAQQPDGIDGWSELIDHTAFAWTDQEWSGFPLEQAVIYELHVGTFSESGTFAGVVDHLDHLIGLGVNAIEVMPVATFPGTRGWGYDGVGLFAAHWSYGGSDGLKALVDACHARGVAVILDVVYNHLGPAGNHLHKLGPYFTSEHHTPWGEAINFDGDGSGPVRQFVIDNALLWIRDHHLDGLRLDAVHAIIDTSDRHILDDIGVAVHAAGDESGRTTWVIAESDLNDPKLVTDHAAGGYGLDAAWSDDFHHALHVALTGEQIGYYSDFAGLADLATALEEVFVYSGQFQPSRGREHGYRVGDVDRRRFIGFAQNHDQVGNRAIGDRLAHLVSPNRLEVAAALVLTAPFIPMLFQGEEWGATAPFLYFTDHQDPELAEAVRVGRRAEFAGLVGGDGLVDADGDGVPDPQDEGTFARSRLDWGELADAEHAGLLEWYRTLIALRRSEPALNEGRPDATQVLGDADHGWLTMRRGPITVVVNLGEPQPVHLEQHHELVLTNDQAVVIDGGTVQMPADAVAILRITSPE